MTFRQGLLCVSVTVTTTPTRIAALIETMLGLTAGQLASTYREVNLQVDPEVSSSASVRLGNGNVGTTKNGVVQKGMTLVGSSYLSRATVNAVYFTSMYVQTVTGTAVLNCFLEEM